MTGTADGTITYWNAVQGKPICMNYSIQIYLRDLILRLLDLTIFLTETG